MHLILYQFSTNAPFGIKGCISSTWKIRHPIPLEIKIAADSADAFYSQASNLHKRAGFEKYAPKWILPTAATVRLSKYKPFSRHFKYIYSRSKRNFRFFFSGYACVRKGMARTAVRMPLSLSLSLSLYRIISRSLRFLLLRETRSLHLHSFVMHSYFFRSYFFSVSRSKLGGKMEGTCIPRFFFLLLHAKNVRSKCSPELRVAPFEGQYLSSSTRFLFDASVLGK